MSDKNIQIATVGGGCFWCVEAVFELLKGVEKTVSGYAGGTPENANYRAVCSGMTKHAEVIQIHFDAAILSYQEILEIFFTTHDPTTLNRQGNDKGPQYRSVVFYANEEEKAIAEKVKNGYAKNLYNNPVVTEISPLEKFYKAEKYHQDYYQKTGDNNPYCTFVVTPKVTKARKLYADKLK